MKVIELNSQNFTEEVLNDKGKVLVDFNASWCGPCRMLKPVIENLSSKITDVKFGSVDVDAESEIAGRYGIMSIPCLILFSNGKVLL